MEKKVQVGKDQEKAQSGFAWVCILLGPFSRTLDFPLDMPCTDKCMLYEYKQSYRLHVFT